jgi:hypothetical protein
MTLEEGYYWSQIALTVIAALAAIGAYIQLLTFKRFELMKVLEEPRIRKARSLLFQRLRSTTPPPPLWWESDHELEEAAAAICASYDIVGMMAQGLNRRFFMKCSYNICWTYEALEGYLEARRHGAP